MEEQTRLQGHTVQVKDVEQPGERLLYESYRHKSQLVAGLEALCRPYAGAVSAGLYAWVLEVRRTIRRSILRVRFYAR